jgi:type II secretory pathway component GspD/PulD (secretin)
MNGKTDALAGISMKSKRLSIMVAAALFVAVMMPCPCRAGIFVYPMQYRTASEVLPSVQTMLSKDGRAVADPRTNALLIDDDEASIIKIREFLVSFDRPGKQVRIRVQFLEAGSADSNAVAADARASGPGWVVTTDPRKRGDGVEVHVQGRSRMKQGSSEFFLSVVSGSPAYIMVGKDILYNETWLDLTRRYSRGGETVGTQRIETGFEVLPVILKDHADVEVTPRISHGGTSGAGRRIIRFSEMTTHVYAPLGQWVTIGGSDQGANEVTREILAAGSRGQGSSVSIRMMVEGQ